MQGLALETFDHGTLVGHQGQGGAHQMVKPQGRLVHATGGDRLGAKGGKR
jgi:hypothetical protein